MKASSTGVDVEVKTTQFSSHMGEAELLCGAALNLSPCALVDAKETVACLNVCQRRIGVAASAMVESAATECAARSAESIAAAAAACDLELPLDATVDVVELRAACTSRCKEMAPSR